MKPTDIDVHAHRKPDFDVDNIFIERWSSRAFSGEGIDHDELMRLFEAARWAPSSNNLQPWHFIYAHRGTPEWDKLFNLLVEFNQMWAKNAAVLVVMVADKREKVGEGDSRTYAFDCGAAWENLSLQASRQGLIAHGMAGFDYDKAREVCVIPDYFALLAMAAIGMPGDIGDLHERMQKSEQPNQRHPTSAFVSNGVFERNQEEKNQVRQGGR